MIDQMSNFEKYLDYINNFITLAAWAEYYQLSEDEALAIYNQFKG